MDYKDSKNLVRQQICQEKQRHQNEVSNLQKRKDSENKRYQTQIQNLSQRKENLFKAEQTSSNESFRKTILELNILLEKIFI